MSVQPVPEDEIDSFRGLVEDYWWELKRSARSVRDEASRQAYFDERFHWDDEHEPPRWVIQEGRPIAFVHFTVEGSRAKIEDFYVDPSARRQGVGSRLVTWTTTYLDGKGVTQIDLTLIRESLTTKHAKKTGVNTLCRVTCSTSLPVGTRNQVSRASTPWIPSCLSAFVVHGFVESRLTVRRDNPVSLTFWESQGFSIGHHQLSMHRDPNSGKAYKGALSSDFSEHDLGYTVWSKR